MRVSFAHSIPQIVEFTIAIGLFGLALLLIGFSYTTIQDASIGNSLHYNFSISVGQTMYTGTLILTGIGIAGMITYLVILFGTWGRGKLKIPL